MPLVRSLRFLLLLGLAVLVASVVFSLVSNARVNLLSRDDDTAARSDDADRIAQRAENVEILRTHEGKPTLRLKASESRTHLNGDVDLSAVIFHLFDSGGAETIVEAPSASSQPAREAGAVVHASTPTGGQPASSALPLEGIGSWVLQGGVTVHARGDLVLSTPSLVYAEDRGQVRGNERVAFTRGPATGNATGVAYDVEAQTFRFLHDVVASMAIGGLGQVTLHAQEADYDVATDRFEMLRYRAGTQRGETLTGTRLVATFREGGGIERLEGDQGFELETTHSMPGNENGGPLSKLLALEGTRVMRGRQIAITFNEAADPMSIEVTGEANLTAAEKDGGGAPASIAAETLVFDLVQGNLSRARAIGDVDLKGATSEGEPGGFHLLSENLDAAFDPNLGSILKVEGEGEIELTDQGIESHGSRTFLDPNTDIVTLTGEEGRPASATWMDRRIQAQGIQADRRSKTLTATGTVRASYTPASTAPGAPSTSDRAVPFFRAGETIHAMADFLTFADKGAVAHYRDHVRLWQGENRLEASRVDLRESSGTLEARGDVISTFHQPPPSGRPAPANPSDQIVTVASGSMDYSRSDNRIVYKGNVLVTQGTMRVTADTMTIVLTPDGSAARLIEASGGVSLRDGDRLGKGDRMVADMQADTVKLIGSGREATIQDLSGQQVVRGSSLTLDRAGDKILVESEVGGRTWITLKPRQKGAPGVVPNPHD